MRYAVAAMAVAALALGLSGCGFLGDQSNGNITPTVAGTSATRTGNALPTPTVIDLSNANWDLAVKDADLYRGSPVDITGQIFNVLGNYDGADHYQLFTDPVRRVGNTHVAVPTTGPDLKEGDSVRVVGTLERTLVVSSRGGGDLRLPYVAASQVTVLSGPGARQTATAGPALTTPVASPSPTAPTATAVPPTATPASPSPTATSAPPSPTATSGSPSPTATSGSPSPTATSASPSPTATPASPSPTATSASPSPTATSASPSPTATSASPSPAATSASPTATKTSPSPTATAAKPSATSTPPPTPTPTRSAGLGVEVPAAALLPNPAMTVTADPNAPSGEYLSSDKGSRNWNGSGPIPQDAGAATFDVQVPKSGRYSVWVRMQYQSVDANSLWLVVDNQRAVLFGNEESGYNTWKWVGWRDGNSQSRVTVDLSAGQHSVTVVSREAGTRFDDVAIVQDPNYKPPDQAPQPSATPGATPPGAAISSDLAAAPSSDRTAPPTALAAAPAPLPQAAAPSSPPAGPSPAAADTSARLPPAAPTPPAPPTITAREPPPTPSPAPPTPVPSPTPASRPNQISGGSYVVQPGDTLSSIAQRAYGDSSQYQRIYAANRDKLSSPDRIKPGQQLQIPR